MTGSRAFHSLRAHKLVLVIAKTVALTVIIAKEIINLK